MRQTRSGGLENPCCRSSHFPFPLAALDTGTRRGSASHARPNNVTSCSDTTKLLSTDHRHSCRRRSHTVVVTHPELKRFLPVQRRSDTQLVEHVEVALAPWRSDAPRRLQQTAADDCRRNDAVGREVKLHQLCNAAANTMTANRMPEGWREGVTSRDAVRTTVSSRYDRADHPFRTCHSDMCPCQ